MNERTSKLQMGRRDAAGQHRELLAESWSLGALLGTLCFLLLVTPVYERIMLHAGITAVLLASVFSNRKQRRIFWASLLMAFVLMPVLWSTLFVDSTALVGAECLIAAAFFFAMAAITLSSVVRYHLASVQSIFGVIAAYLLLGLAWAMVYRATILLDPAAIEFAKPDYVELPGLRTETIAFSQITYFSFVTMSTLGYGDIVPRHTLAQTLAWMQAVSGQFYVAVLVAWLVSALPRPHQSQD